MFIKLGLELVLAGCYTGVQILSVDHTMGVLYGKEDVWLEQTP
jgi:hypothetical protein